MVSFQRCFLEVGHNALSIGCCVRELDITEVRFGPYQGQASFGSLVLDLARTGALCFIPSNPQHVLLSSWVEL